MNWRPADTAPGRPTLLDVEMPGLNGDQIAHRGTMAGLRTVFVLISAYENVGGLARVCGAARGISKDAPRKEILQQLANALAEHAGPGRV